MLSIGLDIGSTTAKIAVIDKNNELIFSKYLRHNAKIHTTVLSILKEAEDILINNEISFLITGSAGLGFSESCKIPFIQEIIASSEFIYRFYPETKTLIDIGGEDSKMIFFNDKKLPDIRMNGNCAGGTGSFIDQMALLLNVSNYELNELAENHTHIYPIASRCGVFAKTDVQNLLSKDIPKEDIVASIFHSLAIQILNTLARGSVVIPKVAFSGGPFTFLPMLKSIFKKTFNLLDEDVINIKNSELIPAYGAAITSKNNKLITNYSSLVNIFEKLIDEEIYSTKRIEPLFIDNNDYLDWEKNLNIINIKKININEYDSNICFLGIDSGSTTTKFVVLGFNNELLFEYYVNNNGNPLLAVKNGLTQFYELIKEKELNIAYSTVTGYGEELIKIAFNLDKGIVETIAHYSASLFCDKKVSFILDIGGQDMKAIFIQNGIINRIELNESCSSGCGTFIESFGNSLGYNINEFSKKAIESQSPFDLGTRCTVFMNSKVKQAIRENSTIEDISAGLSYSVIKNSMNKVLRMVNFNELGDNIILQGGTFKNYSIIRAFEKITNKKIITTNIPQLMGAFGAALISKNEYFKLAEKNNYQRNQIKISDFKKTTLLCNGCDNNCLINKFHFDNNKNYFSGNRCEKIYSNSQNTQEKGINLVDYKINTIFNRPLKSEKTNNIKIGIPRVLNIYENYPFWNKLFVECGFEIILSSISTIKLYNKGAGSIMSDNICFPAKLSNGHIIDLIEKKVDRIFYPSVIYETKENEHSINSFNCPIISGYPEVIESSIDSFNNNKIAFDKPIINFYDKKLLFKACNAYLQSLGIDKKTINNAFKKALEEHLKFKKLLKEEAKALITNAIEKNKLLFVLAGRPYHIDPLINHKIPEILQDFGVDIITEDMVPYEMISEIKKLNVLSQWEYPNRIYNAAIWVSQQKNNIQFVELNSFGCGPDAIVIDESKNILINSGKTHTLIRIDEITSSGAIKLRLRSLIESIKLGNNVFNKKIQPEFPAFEKKDKNKTILAPLFSDIYSQFLPSLFKLSGYNLKNLPLPDKSSVEYGLKHANNEICYPATIIVGDIMKALESGKYNRNEIAIGITQTGGQCRASSYLSLIKKAMINAGYNDIPIVSVSSSSSYFSALHNQPGFKLKWKKIMKITFVSALFADSIAKMYYSTVVREKNAGESLKALNLFIAKANEIIIQNNSKSILKLLSEAVIAFNKIDIIESNPPKIGVVGEIYIKYNSFGHQNILDWLISQKIEVVVTPISDFFIQDFVNIKVNKEKFLTNKKMPSFIITFIQKYANNLMKKIEAINSEYRFYTPLHNINDLSVKASKILDLSNQFGEGWLIPAEISAMYEEGIRNVISLQPFGCIANQIVSKGIEQKIKKLYPDINLLYLDFDAGTSEINSINRLHFMIKN